MGLKTLINNVLRIFFPLLLAIALIIYHNELVGVFSGFFFGLIAGGYEMYRYKKINKYLVAILIAIVITALSFYLLKQNGTLRLLPLILEWLFINVITLMNHKERFINEILVKRREGKELITHTYIELYSFYLKVLIFAFAFHAILSTVTYLVGYNNAYDWLMRYGFFSMVLLYTAFAIGYVFYHKKQLDHEEWLTIVDAKGGVKGKATRKHCHGEEKLLHPVVHLHLIHNNSIYLQKRPLHKDVQPGMWDTAVGGHLSFGEDIENGLKREAFEELGIKDFQPRFLLKYIWETEIEKELVYTFYVKDIENISINKTELEDGKYWPIHQIEENIGHRVFTPNFEKEFELLQTILF